MSSATLTMTHFLSRDRSRPLQSSRLTETSRCIRGAEWGWLRSTSHVVFVTRDFMDSGLPRRAAQRLGYFASNVRNARTHERTDAHQRGDRFENVTNIVLSRLFHDTNFFYSINARKRQAVELRK